MSAISTVLADDHAPLRALIRIVLESNGFHVVAEAATGVEAVDQVLQHRPALCVLDLEMPEGGGRHAITEIRARLPETACVVVSASERPQDLLDCLRMGAQGFLPKGMDLERLPQALRGVLRGEAAVPRAQVTVVLDELRRGPDVAPGHHVVDLTDDEWRVVRDLRVRAGDRTGARRWLRRSGGDVSR